MDICSNKFFVYNNNIEYAENFENLFPKEDKLVYEVIRIIEGKPLFLQEHVKRLENSMNLLDPSKETYSYQYIKSIVDELVRVNEIVSGNMKLIIGRNDLLAYSIPHSYPTEDMYLNGVKTILYFGERNNPNAKIVNNKFKKEVGEKIEKVNAYEAILVNKNDFITEGSKSNIFMIKDGIVYTAPIKEVLPGITREKVILACNICGFRVEEKHINYKSLNTMDGLFISGTSPKVLPINEVESVVKYNYIIDDIEKIKNNFQEIIKNDIDSYNINMY